MELNHLSTQELKNLLQEKKEEILFHEGMIEANEAEIEQFEEQIDLVTQYYIRVRELESDSFDHQEDIEWIVSEIREIESRIEEIYSTIGVKYSYKELEEQGQLRFDYIGSELLSV